MQSICSAVTWLCILEQSALIAHKLWLLFPSKRWLIGHQSWHAPSMRALAAELSSKQTWKSRPAKSLVSPYHPLGRQSRISCICGQTRPPPLPRIARLLRKPRQCALCFPNPVLRVGIHITMWLCFWSLGLPESLCLSLKSTKIISPQWKHFPPGGRNFS